MAPDRRPTTVAVWGHFHGGNLGDDLVVATVIDAARRRLPGVELLGISLAPRDTAVRHAVPAFPLNPGSLTPPRRAVATTASHQADASVRSRARRIPPLRWARRAQVALTSIARELPFLRSSYALLRRVDLVVVAGSGQLVDAWGVWQHPYATFRWAALARLARTRVAYPSVGAGPIATRRGAFLIRTAVGWSDHVTVRDEESARVLLQEAGLPGPFPIVPDMAFALPETFRAAAAPPDPGAPGPGIVGLNVMAHHDPRYFTGSRPGRYAAYLEKMAALVEWLVAEGYTIRLFSSQTLADGVAAADVLAMAAERGVDTGRIELLEDEIGGIADLIRVVSGCNFVVAARFHSALIPLLFGIPVLGLAYHPKTSQLLADSGYPNPSFDIDSVTSPQLIAAFRALRDAGRDDAPPGQPNARVLELRAAVERQFDELFTPLR